MASARKKGTKRKKSSRKKLESSNTSGVDLEVDVAEPEDEGEEGAPELMEGSGGRAEEEAHARRRPSALVDLVWHTHLMFPQRYGPECRRIAGVYLDHLPE